MKRFFQFIRNKDVRHAALQKTFPRVVIGLLICFLWDRFLNSGGRLNVYGHAFMAVGLIYASAWMVLTRRRYSKGSFSKSRQSAKWGT